MLSTRAQKMHVYRLEVRRLWGCSPNFYPVEMELAQALDLWPKESEGRSILVISAKPLRKDEPVRPQHLSDPFVVLYGQFANWGETPLEYLERHPHYWQKKPFTQELSAAILAHAGPAPSDEERQARSQEAYLRALGAEEAAL